MIYESIVVGGGHAGVEAAYTLSKKHKTLLITGNLKQIAILPCNPSIGGPAKGVVVREIDALGGLMGKAADLSQIQIKMLNTSKGPAVRSLRAQIDKVKYPQVVLEFLKKNSNLFFLESLVKDLIIEKNIVKGVRLQNNSVIYSQTVIITAGTYLSSQILIGKKKINQGPNNSPTTYGISYQLSKKYGFEIIRLKTGTPPRVKKNTIDYSKTKIQKGDDFLQTFSSPSIIKEIGIQKPCFLVYTNSETHKIIKENLDKSPMYSGYIKSKGPRYCPSIEDKIVRFCDKERHQIFIEPESLELEEMYLQGLSTSFPEEIQHQILKTIPALEKAKIVKYAYAIEYDAFNPNQLKYNLETKKIKNLFLAGQINGTSGYEEAACQGLMAGINASLRIQKKDIFVLNRKESYIGVLIDDLINKGTSEPYRLLTSRAEFRLLLRHDNADLRLTHYAYNMGLIEKKIYEEVEIKRNTISFLKDKIKKIVISPNKQNLDFLKKYNSSLIKENIFLYQLLKRNEIDTNALIFFLDKKYNQDILEQLMIQIKYENYILKAEKEADKLIFLEKKIIPNNINYDEIHNLSMEAKEKLNLIKPNNLGQASRILGINPSDISIINIYLKRYQT
ncbi:MAG: tRNA uridine-5-carboxymethylaminomethyl(34) synthesis enzyme [Candidatus Phytoplasma cynodontis]|uniref:tRNA uridine-5-carboxymethylaminomethyl(34) synthesis enzyme MnmG n=1 Tax='Cynodon dactylon' phytoplasma TaxID=295320 RepID=UPI001265BF72|nr:tRNA uridine-5-carboxymethylaminomethyl(34) synthesis enzyme MnmG ['Cynodon dactylon' phytoplasma]KAB8122131.1 tRNA uridine-5-carboxymethylaminomethyl(34) synthesis enzyme MnmG ['Cynodon dactylon' phytoplasma]WIA07892.1 MAG: tRNA uridine-5-carboxymethylaminomethyl(34) synthesis enzyme [Candidatus Phytoplasma cynodontis]